MRFAREDSRTEHDTTATNDMRSEVGQGAPLANKSSMIRRASRKKVGLSSRRVGVDALLDFRPYTALRDTQIKVGLKP